MDKKFKVIREFNFWGFMYSFIIVLVFLGMSTSFWNLSAIPSVLELCGVTFIMLSISLVVSSIVGYISSDLLIVYDKGDYLWS
jgi:hypothetical protein